MSILYNVKTQFQMDDRTKHEKKNSKAFRK